MHNQPRADAYEESDFFADGQVNRQLVEGTVARGRLERDKLQKAARNAEGALADTYPFPVTRTVLKRGQERYGIYCAMCHGATGHGDGMIVQRGFVPPPSFHLDRLREAPAGHFFNVITNGFGAMYSYNDRIPAEDRWAIAAYVRVLQLSQNAEVALLPPEDRQRVAQAATQPAARKGATHE